LQHFSNIALNIFFEWHYFSYASPHGPTFFVQIDLLFQVHLM